MSRHCEVTSLVVPVVGVRIVRPYVLDVEFADGERRTIDVEPMLWGEVFELLRDPERFAEVTVDPVLGTVVWPNGADLAPEFFRKSSVESLAGAAGKLTDSLPFEEVRRIAREDRFGEDLNRPVGQ